MRIPLVNALRRLDRHLLLNHPVFWMMRLHWMICFGLLGLALTCLVALVVAVSLPSVNFLNTYFWAILALAVLAVSPWFYLQARFAPQLRQNVKARTAVYLLAGYIFIFGIHLAWPYGFVYILEGRISSRIDEREIQKDFDVLRRLSYSAPPDPREVQNLWLKYNKPDNGEAIIRGNEILDAIIWTAAIKGVSLKDLSRNYEPRDYYNWVVVPQVVLLLALFLLIFQMADTKSLLMSLLFGIAVWVAVVIYDSSDFSGKADGIVFSFLLFLFAAGGCSTLLVPRLKRKNTLFVCGLNVFTLLLAWMPYFCLLLSIDGPHSDETYIDALCLGSIMLFAVMPWIQRSYLALQSKPSS